MKLARIAVVLFALGAAFVYAWYRRVPAAPTHRGVEAPPDAAPVAHHEPIDAARSNDAAVAIARTVRDRALRDDLRRRIFLAWSHAVPTNANAAPVDPLHAPMPVLGASDRVDPDYLRARIREDFIPMTSVCFESFVSRSPDASALEGRVIIEFTVLGDAHIGGVVDDVALDDERDGGSPDANFGDAEFRTCLRESMMSMAFAPPPQGGRLRVRYPFRFASGDH